MKRLYATALLLLALSAPLLAQEGKPLYDITVFRSDTTFGTITLELFPDIAPLHVRNFDSLVAIGFYDSTAFHRVLPGFVIQGGDPNTRSGPEETWGFGDPSQATVPAEFNPISHRRGILSAARSADPNSATSQFFIVVAAATGLDGRYTVYGRVIDGMDVVDTIVAAPKKDVGDEPKSRPIDKITVTIVRTGIDTTTPGVPELLGPTDDTTRIKAALELRWLGVPGAILYEVQVSRTPSFSILDVHDSVTTISATVRPLQAGQQRYYWRVRASNGGRRGGFSEVRTFTTGIAAATLEAPANSAVDVAKPVPFTWSSVPNATSYRLQVATSIGFTTRVLDTAGLTDTSFVLAGLNASQRYFWRVFATDGAGDTSQSARWMFTTDAVAGIDLPATPGSPASTTLDLTARDAGDAIELTLTIASPADATLDIADATLDIADARGNLVRRYTAHDLAAGHNIFRILKTTLASGAYYAHATASIATASTSFILP